MTEDPLEHAARSALWGDQAHMSLGIGNARRFRPDIGPIAAALDNSPASLADLGQLAKEFGPLGLLKTGDAVDVPGTAIVRRAEGVQMIFAGSAPPARTGEPAIERLDENDYPAMLELARLTEPGPFEARTGDLGAFFGIRDRDGRLIAMAGQRLRFAGHVELSGVCTQPDTRGRGYGALLSLRVVAAILAEGRVPMLHAYAGNEGAIALYRRLGFVHTRSLWLTIYAPTD